MTAEVEELAAYLEASAVTLHNRFIPGYGGLQGRQNGPSPRTFEARLRLTVERHFVDALRIGGHAVDVWLDYDDDNDHDAPLDVLRPGAVVVARRSCSAPLEISLGWPARGLKTLRLIPPAALNIRPVTILLGAADAGEALTTTLSQMIAAAVVALGDAALETV